MTNRIIPAALAVAFLATLSTDIAFARGGGGGGGGGGFGGGGNAGGHTDGGSGRTSFSRPDNASDQRLFDQARQECNGPKYPSGATPRINYDADTFTCFEPGSTRR